MTHDDLPVFNVVPARYGFDVVSDPCIVVDVRQV
jgi:hypothetical protein